MPFLLPTNGSEPAYVPDQWNNSKVTRKLNNCYAYFLQDLDGHDRFPQPGALADRRKRPFAFLFLKTEKQTQDRKGNKKGNKKPFSLKEPYTCKDVRRAVFADNHTILPSSRFTKCPSRYYKGFLAVDDGNKDGDYHFYIQDADGYWSHKPGEQAVRRTDKKQELVRDPFIANRGRYNLECGYFCVPSNDYRETQSASTK